MGPIELIRSGIDKKSWDLVIAGYEILSGQKLSTQDNFMATMKSADSPIRKEQEVQDENGVVKTLCAVESFKPGFVNLFVDDGSLFREDSKANAAIPKNKTLRRPPHKPLIKICKNCQRKYEAVIEGELYCNDCGSR